MKQEIHLLEHGLFEKHFMDSRATTRAVSKKELVFGHLLGPLGLIFIVNTIAALVEKFFTQQVGAMYGTANVDMIRIMGGRYEVIMTVAKLLAMGHWSAQWLAGAAHHLPAGTYAALVSDFRLCIYCHWRADIPVSRAKWAGRQLLVLFLLPADLLPHHWLQLLLCI